MSSCPHTEELSVKSERAKSRVQCQACGIGIGPKYMETRTYRVGDYEICPTCLGQLKYRGRVQVEPYGARLYLCRNGTVGTRRKEQEP